MKTAPPRVLLKTSTDELFLPSRIVYHVWDEKELVTRLRQLRCMAFDRPGRRWTWNFEHEAKAMGFPAIYESGPAARQGVVLASGYLVDASTFHVYVRCVERLVKFLVFFDRAVPRSCAKAEFLDEFNLVTTVGPGEAIPAPEDFFRNEREFEFLDIETEVRDRRARGEDAAAWMQALTRRPLQARERHRMDLFYEDGLTSFQSNMQFRAMLAMKQHLEGRSIRPYDVIRELMESDQAGKNQFPLG